MFMGSVLLLDCFEFLYSRSVLAKVREWCLNEYCEEQPADDYEK